MSPLSWYLAVFAEDSPLRTWALQYLEDYVKRIILVRHGHYDSDSGPNLTSRGREEVGDLAERLKTMSLGAISIAHSTALRATSSATIIRDALGVQMEPYGSLSAEAYSNELAALLEFVRARMGEDADTLILVTHLPYLRSFPSYFAQHELGVSSHAPMWTCDVPTGNGKVIDCIEKTIAYL